MHINLPSMHCKILLGMAHIIMKSQHWTNFSVCSRSKHVSIRTLSLRQLLAPLSCKAPACVADSSLAECAGAVSLARRLIQEQREAGLLSEAEATCRDLSRTLLGDPGLDSKNSLLPELSLELARIVMAQGRLDEARQLCEQADSHVSANPF